ncbi:MAG: hypothetical protein PSX81_02765 [bacterium]|nr:hypothetical protein [bacterium]
MTKANFRYILQTLSVIIVTAVIYIIIQKYKVKNDSIIQVKNADTTIAITHFTDSTSHVINNINYYVTKTITTNIPAVIDTQAVLKDYYSKKTGSNNYRDSNMSITVFDTLFKNSIVGRGLNYKILRPNTTIEKTITNTVTKTIERKSRDWYVGSGYTTQYGIYPTLSFVTNKWQVNTGAFYFNPKNQVYPFINLQIKIK